jgi:hypothetical protein
MRLLGPVNWWAPRPLRRLYARYGIREAYPAGAGSPGQPAGSSDINAPAMSWLTRWPGAESLSRPGRSLQSAVFSGASDRRLT